MLLIGSRALARHYPNYQSVEGRDWDYIAKYDDVQEFAKQFKKEEVLASYTVNEAKYCILKLKDGRVYEFELAWPGTSAERILNMFSKSPGYASLGMLFLLKTSHRYLKNSPHFLKTMRDYQFLKKKGIAIPAEWKDLLAQREKETYNYELPKLNMGKGTFFKKEESFYVYDHDTIHLAVKHLEKPAYEYFKADNAEVWCDYGKWNAQSESVKICAVLEESYVLALERSQIPFDFKPDPEESFLKALEKVCTSITSGWFREYAYENYDKVLYVYYNRDGGSWYVRAFRAALAEGLIKEFKHESAP